MIASSANAYTTSDLRRAEVVDEAFSRPVSIRDGKTGNLLLMVPQEQINRSNDISRAMQLFTRVVVECQRTDPSPVGLDQVSYIVDWTPARRQQFIRDFAEALSASITAEDPTIVEAFIGYMANAQRSVPAPFHSSFLDSERDLLNRHMARQ
jgi:hypothetical protein